MAISRQDWTEAQVEEEVAALLEGTDPDGTDEWGRMTVFAAMLTLCIRRGEECPELLTALEALSKEPLKCRVVWEISGAHVLSGRLADAEAMAAFGLEEGGLGTSPHSPFVWHIRAEAARLLGRWEDALDHLKQMEEHLLHEPTEERPRAGFHHARFLLAQTRCQVLLELGLLDRCRQLADEAMEEALVSGRSDALAAARLLFFDLELMAANPPAALECVRKGLNEPHLAKWHGIFRLAEGIALVEEVRGDVAAKRDPRRPAAGARAAFEAAGNAFLSLSDRLKLAIGRFDLEMCLGEHDAARAHVASAREVLPVGALPPREAVLVPALAWRLARATQAGTSEVAAVRDALLAAYEGMLEQWGSTPVLPGGIGFLHLSWRAQVLGDVIDAELHAYAAEQEAKGEEAQDERDQQEETRLRELERLGVERAFERLLEAQALGTRARERGLRTPTIAEIRRELLAPGRALLVVHLAQDSGHLFVLDERPLEHFAIPVGRDALRSAAGRVTAALVQPDGAVDPRKLGSLRDELLPAAARKRLEDRTGLIVVGFDVLRDLPFGILAGSDGVPYGQRVALVTLPSVALGIELARADRAASAATKELLLVVGGAPPPELELELEPFDFERADRTRLLAPFPGEHVEVLEEPTRDAFLSAHERLGGARLLHFLAHGIALPGREFSAALILGGKGAECMFAAEDVAGLRVGGLVVLSACSAGRGPARIGDDSLVNLGGAFFEAGARCVVLSRFPVEYHSTVALMERFHARLAEGDSPAEALRAARAAVAGQDGLASFHAASFEVLGLGFEPVFPR